MRNLVLGSLSVTGLTDINSFSLPVKTLFPSFDDKILNEKEALDPKVISNGLIHLTIRSWLLRQFGQNILIDCCVGAHKNRPNHPNWHKRDGKDWLKALIKEGLRPEDIDSKNTVLSSRIANAKISYTGAGDIADSSKKGWFTKLIDAVQPL